MTDFSALYLVCVLNKTQNHYVIAAFWFNGQDNA